LNKETAKKIAIYSAGGYFIYSLFNYGWWRYNNAKTVAKGKRVRQLRDSKTYTFKKVENE
jgi:hypothetical protein